MLTLISGLVIIAGFIRNTVLVCVMIHPYMISTKTWPCPRAIDHVLHRQVCGRPGSFALDVDAVCKRMQWMRIEIPWRTDGLYRFPIWRCSLQHLRCLTCKRTCRTHCPTRTAILRDVLVSGGADIVLPIYVSPVPSFREIGNIYVFVGTRICPITIKRKSRGKWQHHGSYDWYIFHYCLLDDCSLLVLTWQIWVCRPGLFCNRNQRLDWRHGLPRRIPLYNSIRKTTL